MISYDLSSCVLLGRTERAAFQRSRILLPSIERLQCCPSLTMNWPPVERQNNANKTAHPKEPSIQKKDNHAFASDRRIEHRFWSRGHGPLRPEKSKVSKVNVMFSLSLSLSLSGQGLLRVFSGLFSEVRGQESKGKGSLSLSLSLFGCWWWTRCGLRRSHRIFRCPIISPVGQKWRGTKRFPASAVHVLKQHCVVIFLMDFHIVLKSLSIR